MDRLDSNAGKPAAPRRIRRINSATGSTTKESPDNPSGKGLQQHLLSRNF
jgi:hypothetical protein